jgi:hypothetical protein
MRSVLSVVEGPSAKAQPNPAHILMPPGGKHEPLEWHLMRRSDEEGVPIVEAVPKGQMDMDLGPSIFSMPSDFRGHYVPEPGTGALLALGAIGLLMRRGRRGHDRHRVR